MMQPGHRSLEQTPTWAVAGVCTVFVVLSLCLERGIHHCGKRFKKKNQKPLSEALGKMKAELMLMGFISLLLSVFQPLVSDLCIPRSSLHYMLPCQLEEIAPVNSTHDPPRGEETIHNRRLLSGWLPERGADRCAPKGMVPMISAEGLHQLHLFIFVMAVVHLCYSCLTMLLGRIMVFWWKRWEDEVRNADKRGLKMSYSKLRLKTFVRKHAKRPWSRLDFLNWIASFMRHLLCKPVTRADYLTLRSGFLKNYKLERDFDFHGYISRVLENDFKVVVGISGFLWAFVIVFLLLNVHGWHTYFWMAFLPLALILVIGTKLQYIITELACEISELEDQAGEEVAIKPRDDLFWFNRPRLLLHLIHFTLFQNAFELAFFFWVWATYGFDACFMDSVSFIVIRLLVGFAVQFLCSYSTLPLYVLVTQMGSHYSKAIFTKRINKGMKQWQKGAKLGAAHGKSGKKHQAHGDGLESLATSTPEEKSQCHEQRLAPTPLEELMIETRNVEEGIELVSSPVQRIMELELPPAASGADFAIVEIV